MKTPDYNFPDFVHEVSFRKHPRENNTTITLRHWAKGNMYKHEKMYSNKYEKKSLSISFNFIITVLVDDFKIYLQSKNVL